MPKKCVFNLEILEAIAVKRREKVTLSSPAKITTDNTPFLILFYYLDFLQRSNKVMV